MRKNYIWVLLLLTTLLLVGCSWKEDTATETEAENVTQEQPTTGLAYESAKDTAVDIKALQIENQDVFAWLYIPGTGIDLPVLQSEEADDYYESHNAFGEISEEGALYTELANLKDMCDFNTVIHGKTSSDGNSGQFHELYRYLDPEFFEKNELLYLFLDGNLLTYEVFAAYERENTSLIRTYDFTYIAGCQEFLDALYEKEMGKNIREGWEGISPGNFLITLTTTLSEDSDRQLVVVAALVGDAAGTIDRAIME